MSILHTCIVIIALAMIVPGILVQVFTGYFTKRIVMLRHVMHQASNEAYEFFNSFFSAVNATPLFSNT